MRRGLFQRARETERKLREGVVVRMEEARLGPAVV
jgi:hypothetical protein